MKDFITEYGHTKERLKELQALPLERKVGFTAARIAEWYNHFKAKFMYHFRAEKIRRCFCTLFEVFFPMLRRCM